MRATLRDKVAELEDTIAELRAELETAAEAAEEARSLQEAAEAALTEREKADDESEHDQDLCDLLSDLADRRLSDRAECMEWLRDARSRKLWQEMQAAAPVGLRLVYSAPKVSALRQQPQAARGGGKGGKVRPKGKVPAKVPAKAAARRRQQPAEDWDW